MWRSGSFEGRSILHLDPLLPNFFNQIDSCVYLFHKLIEACFSIQSIFHKKLIVWKDVVSISLLRKLYSTSLFIRNSKVSSHFLIVLMVKEDFFALLWERSRVPLISRYFIESLLHPFFFTPFPFFVISSRIIQMIFPSSRKFSNLSRVNYHIS